MQIPDCLIWAMGFNGCTAVKIFCKKDLRKEIAMRFTDVFVEELDKLKDLIREEEGDCMEMNPFTGPQISDYGVFLPFDCLAMYCDEEGSCRSSYDAGDALEAALKIIKKEYPSIRYDGYAAYCWSDIHSGEACQYEISSVKRKKDVKVKVYDFVGKALRETLEDEYAWDSLTEEIKYTDPEEIKKIIRLFHTYSEWIPSEMTDKIIEIYEENGRDIKRSLREYTEALRKGKDIDID